MMKNHCPGLEFRIFVRDKIEQGCTTDNTFSIKSQSSCPKGNFGGLYPSTTTGLEIGASPTGITCWFLSLDNLWDARRSEVSRTSPQRMPKGLFNSDSAIPPLSGTLSRKQICSETRESSRSSLSIWCLLRKKEAYHKGI